MLLMGLLAGVALTAAAGVFLLGIGWAAPVEAVPVISASPSPSPSPSASAQSAQSGDVSEACVRSAEYNIAVEGAVDELARGAEEEDAKKLQETLDKLQDERDKADGAAEECLAQAGKSSDADPSASASESISAQPSATSTP